MKKGFLTGAAIGLISLGVLVSFHGCGSDLATGIGIGAGAGVGLTEAQKLAKESKAALVGEILELRAELEQTTDPAKIEALETQLAALQRKMDIVEITEEVSNTVVEGIGREWTSSEPETQKENIHWIVNAVFGALAVWQTRKKKVLEAGVGKFQGKGDGKIAGELHDEITNAGRSLWPSTN